MKLSVVTLPVFLSRVLTIVTSWIRLIVMLRLFETALVNDAILTLIVDDVHS